VKDKDYDEKSKQDNKKIGVKSWLFFPLTNYLHGRIVFYLTILELVKILPKPVAPEMSKIFSQRSKSFPYPKEDESNARSPILFL